MLNQKASLVAPDSAARDSSFELLRILSMFTIVLYHFAIYGDFSFDAQTLSLPRFWYNAIKMGGNFGVDTFVLISGYFLINGKGEFFNRKRILKFWGQVIFYSAAIYVIFGIAGVSEFSAVSLARAIFPITYGSWWFASTYFVLYLIHPFINLLLHKLDRGTFQKLLVMLIILWCIIPTFTLSNYQSNALIWFVTLYCTAAYIRLYGLNPAFTCRHYVWFWVVFSLLRYLSSVILLLAGTRIAFAAEHSFVFYEAQSLLTFLSALSLFMVFEKKKIGTNKWINIVASASFGVYLIHENDIIRPFLWLTVFKNAAYQDSVMLIPYSIFAATLVYAVCSLIDLVRQQIFEKPFMKAVSMYSAVWLKPFEALICFSKKIVFGEEYSGSGQ